MSIRPPVLHIAAIAALVVIGLAILGFATTTDSWGSAAIFVGYCIVGAFLVTRRR